MALSAQESLFINSNLDQISSKEIITNENCIVGDKDFLINRLREAFKKAVKIDIIVAFLMESGVKLLEQDLRDAVDRGIHVRVLTGNYLNITEPHALYLLKDIMGDKVDLRFYNVPNRSFHPKAYFFEYKDRGDIFVGSSNISRSALTSGIEWNYRLTKDGNPEDFNHFKKTFEDLFNNKSIVVDEEEMKRYSKSWVKPKVSRSVEHTEEEQKEQVKVTNLFEPRGAQIEALYELRKTREEGFDKGLVVAATGIGKTYLAAFDSMDFNRILFVAHREEILKQAEQSFKNVRPEKSTGFFYGNKKEANKDILFATVQTLGKDEYLSEGYFSKEYFDYIIIDEFHHAAAGNYRKIIDYFNPKFLLGLTATPERLDNKDVFALCDYNVVYEVRLKSAINKEWLVPFRYYGIYDEAVNYEEIEFKNGIYVESKLEEALMINKRAELIIKHYDKYRSDRALGFCSTRKHAEYMAEYFCKAGIKACAVISNGDTAYSADREEAVKKLVKGEVKVIFSVDMFNEGLDIPAVDLVMFLRPTESPTVFLQQLGRGLRKAKDKRYLNVLDFIGNYKKANLVPFFLTGQPKALGERKVLPKEEEYPEDCFIDFDFRLVDIFKRMDAQSKKLQDLVAEEYFRIKEDLGHRPSRAEMFTYIDDDVYDNIRRRSSENIFRNYFRFLEEIKELSSEEKELIGTVAGDCINMIENTGMVKSYKMPVLLAFYNNGNLKLCITEDDVYISFKDFYRKGTNGVDLLNQKSTAGYKNWERKQWYKLAKDNPIKFLAKSDSEFFSIEEKGFCLKSELSIYTTNDTFIRNFKDAIDMRTLEYYKHRYESKRNI